MFLTVCDSVRETEFSGETQAKPALRNARSACTGKLCTPLRNAGSARTVSG